MPVYAMNIPTLRTLVPRPFVRIPLRGFKVGKSPRKDEVFQVPIESLDKLGNGIVTIEWDTMQKQIEPTKIVVRGALPGETVRVRVVSVYSRGGSALHTVRFNVFGRQEHLVRPRLDSEPWRSTLDPDLLPAGHTESKDFRQFSCPHFDRRNDVESCRGCAVPHLHYSRQIIEKSRLLRASLSGAVDDEVLANLHVEPRSQITRFSSRFEIFAFSKRPLETPEWGQLAFKDPLPGERRNKYYIPTPECKVMSKSAQAVVNRMAELVAVAHSEHPNLFSVHSEVIRRGFLRSAVVQTATDRDGRQQVLLNIITATEPTPQFVRELTDTVADRLMNEFPLLEGVVLTHGNVSTDRDGEMFADSSKTRVLVGEGSITEYIPSVARDVRISPSTALWDREVNSKLFGELSDILATENDSILELFSGDGSITEVLREVSSNVCSLTGEGVMRLVDGGEELVQRHPVDDHLPLLTGSADSSALSIRSGVGIPSHVDDGAHSGVLPRSVSTAVLSFPTNDNAKPEVKGVTPKAFRHWLGNVVRPRRIVIVTDKFDGLRKDIGHMKLLGYELKSIKAFDGRPGQLDKIVTVVVLQLPPRYDQLTAGQLIE